MSAEAARRLSGTGGRGRRGLTCVVTIPWVGFFRRGGGGGSVHLFHGVGERTIRNGRGKNEEKLGREAEASVTGENQRIPDGLKDFLN